MCEVVVSVLPALTKRLQTTLMERIARNHSRADDAT
jgi:hypothetical protein